jgi:chorismate dehydratase
MTLQASHHETAGRSATRVRRIGSVSYLNARPLIYGLERSADVQLVLDVPARLLDGLRSGRFDIALLPVIDYQRMEGLRLVPVGGIGCDGPTLTVRIFSRVPLERITALACDTDSHSSVALARIIFSEMMGIRPEFMELDRTREGDGRSEAMLVIGDKVVCEEPRGYEHQLDLGAAWKELTGLPFVFAAWMAPAEVELGDLPRRLDEARVRGLANVERIVAEHAVPRGWPENAARAYLLHSLRYEIGPLQLEAIRRFHQLAGKHGLVPAPARELVIV